jgi:hypothetical protein
MSDVVTEGEREDELDAHGADVAEITPSFCVALLHACAAEMDAIPRRATRERWARATIGAARR